MDFIKDFLDEGRSRIKSRFFASFAFAFIAINWRELFYLAFSEASAEDRIRYFDTHTDFGGYVLGPLILGAVIAAGLPFVNNFFHGIVSGQVSAVRSRDDEYAHQRLKKKNEWESERNRALELLVEKAEIAERADQIKDDAAKADLKEKISRPRGGALDAIVDDTTDLLARMTGDQSEKNDRARSLELSQLSKTAKVWLKRINASEYGSVSQDFIVGEEEPNFSVGQDVYTSSAATQDYASLKAAIRELQSEFMLEENSGTYVVTKLGQEIAHEIEREEETPF